jgi:hypothetical protein
LPGQDLFSGVFGVDRVALAGQSPLSLSRRPGYLEGLVIVKAQEPCQPDAIRAAILDTPATNPPKTLRPCHQLAMADVVGVDLKLADPAPEPVEGDRDVLVLVGVDSDDNLTGFKRDAGHDC